MSPPTAHRLSAIFGVYGELPLVAVRLDDGFVLMDPLAGNLSGPFAPDSVLDARGLLSAYEGDGVYAQGSGIRYLTSQGCPTVAAAGWKDEPPPNKTVTPAAPPTPAPPAGSPQSSPGHWQPWVCTITLQGKCLCTSSGFDDQVTPATTPPTQIQVQIICTCNAVGDDCPNANPLTPATPNAPPVISPTAPAVVPTPGGYPTCVCKKQWLY